MIKDTLLKLLAVHGATGHEEKIAAVIADMLRPYADSVETDVLGNLIVKKSGAGKRVMLAAHMDHIGFIATDADKEGFLRSTGSLIQTFGRAARNAGGRVLLYADAVTPSMRSAMDETARRRTKQEAWNEAHGTTPTTISKPLVTPFDSLYASSGEGKSRGRGKQAKRQAETAAPQEITAQNVGRYLKQLEREMRDAARDLEFEKAAALRDRIRRLREQFLVA